MSHPTIRNCVGFVLNIGENISWSLCCTHYSPLASQHICVVGLLTRCGVGRSMSVRLTVFLLRLVVARLPIKRRLNRHRCVFGILCLRMCVLLLHLQFLHVRRISIFLLFRMSSLTFYYLLISQYCYLVIIVTLLIMYYYYYVSLLLI